MPTELKVPSVGESITEVEIGEWRKAPGDAVRKDETVVVLESEKATVELPAPADGVMGEILKQKGETAFVGEVIAYLQDGTAPAPKAAGPASSKESAPRKGEPKVMPAAQRALAESGLKAEEVSPSGPGGRLLKEDVLKHQPPAAPAEEPTPAESPRPKPAGTGAREEQIVPMTRLRRTVAQRLVAAQQNAALLTTFNEADMSGVMALRKEFGEAFQTRYGVKLGFMSFFVKGVVEALKAIPSVNAEIRGNDIVYRNYYDIGVAVGGGRGLVVPIIRNAERLSFAEIEMAIGDFGKRARENKLKVEELQGGTFTISNGGIYGSLLSTPIVNPPQSGILGMHAIQERPVAREGQVVIRPMMYLALSYDHRLVDGREAVTFLKRLKETVENPARILLEV